ncbi:MAG: hypothetical protein NTY95_17420 [Bacteroidia bacterium]|nr:hypothetical protein [Bacteroidia bacterium]
MLIRISTSGVILKKTWGDWMINFYKRSDFKIFLLIASLLILGGCGKVSLTSNSFADTSSIPYGFPAGSSFFVMFTHTDSELISQNIATMISNEVSQKIADLLKHKGYTIANSYEHSDYVLVFRLGMTSFKTIVNIPIYIPGQTQTTNGYINDRYGYAGNYHEEQTTSGTFIYVPQEKILFNRTFVAQVYNAKSFREKKEEKQIWIGYTASVGENADMRKMVDYLLLSTFRYFGKNTTGNINSEMNYKSKEVEDLRNNFPVKQKKSKKKSEIK